MILDKLPISKIVSGLRVMRINSVFNRKGTFIRFDADTIVLIKWDDIEKYKFEHITDIDVVLDE